MKITSDVQSTGGDDDVPQSTEPTPAELSDGVARLLAEVDAVLSTDRWAILDTGSDHGACLLYDAASLRHCCLLLAEIEVATHSRQELTVRLLGRTHLEAWLTALYIHFGGHRALTRIAQNTRHQLEITSQEAQQFDSWLTEEKKSAKKRTRKINAVNEGISRWNSENPGRVAKSLHEDPYVPQLSTTHLDLSNRIADFEPYEAQSLSISEIVDALTKLAPGKGFGRESLRPIYLLYRILSSVASHSTFNVYDAYFMPPFTSGGFFRVAPSPVGSSLIDTTRITALYATSFLASWVLGDAGCATPVADELRARLEPDPSSGACWMPGI